MAFKLINSVEYTDGILTVTESEESECLDEVQSMDKDSHHCDIEIIIIVITIQTL